MANFGYFSQKIRNGIDGILCRSMAKRTQKLPAGRYVSLCFDDFPQSAALNAAPMIEGHAWRATWYVAGGFMGGEEPHYGTMFTEMDLKRLVHMGHDIGCHTYDHLDCSEADAEEILVQCDKNAAFLKEHGVSDFHSFAYPFGNASLASKQLMGSTGLALRGVKPGINQGDVDMNMLKACGLQDDNKGMLRALEELDQLRSNDGWLIIFTHDVCDTPSPWGVLPEDYEHLLQAVKASGAEVVTVGDMVKRLEKADQDQVRRAA